MRALLPEACVACMPQVLGRTLSLQFDGNWTAVEGVVVDKLGKYAYAIPGVGGAPATPFILDVALDVRAKVCLSMSPVGLADILWSLHTMLAIAA